MSRQPEGHTIEELTVAARRVLLDAMGALKHHAAGVIVVGAQAISLRADEARLPSLTSFTSDADLGLDPRLLGDEPLLEDAMVSAGFALAVPPGTWSRREPVGTGSTEVAVDLLVPDKFGGRAPKGARAARIPPHGRAATRRVMGLEAAVVDNDPLYVGSLGAEPAAGVTARVAGVAALLVAKAYKIADRMADPKPGRLQDKDAADVVRLMQIGKPHHVTGRFQVLLENAEVTDVVSNGLALLRGQFGSRRATGTTMAVGALRGVLPPTLVESIGPAFLDQMPAPARAGHRPIG